MLDDRQPAFTLLAREIAWVEPVLAATAWADEPYLAWLDSGGDARPQSRYSYVAAEPFRVMTDLDEADPFGALAAELARWKIPAGAAPVPFVGGAVGFIGYGMAAHLERVANRHGAAAGPGMMMAFYDVVLAFDHLQRRVWLLSSGFPASGIAKQARAERRAEETLRRLELCKELPETGLPDVNWAADLTCGDYENQVRRVLGYIYAGDIFQANFTTRFAAPRPAGLTPFGVHLALRAANPAPFGAYINCGGGFALASMSPERFISVDGSGRMETRPIKGTRRRGGNAAEDARLRDELRGSAKDHAENLMIVDLMRSDIGRVAEIGSVQVEALCQVESFANLHHLVSVITARLQPGLGPVDVLRAAFPGGSVTGAPKLQAMEIIDELEAAARGAYCGVIGWIGFDGAMDTSIVIRTLCITPTQLIAQAGGGIVADSNPADEYEEMMLKIRPLLAVFGQVPT